MRHQCTNNEVLQLVGGDWEFGYESLLARDCWHKAICAGERAQGRSRGGILWMSDSMGASWGRGEEMGWMR